MGTTAGAATAPGDMVVTHFTFVMVVATAAHEHKNKVALVWK
jgi:hypothetical protein